MKTEKVKMAASSIIEHSYDFERLLEERSQEKKKKKLKEMQNKLLSIKKALLEQTDIIKHNLEDG